MKTITYNPETHVLVPREPSQGMIDAMPPVEEIGYWAMYEAAIAAAPQPEPNHNWCAGCSPDNCSGCGAEPVESEPAMWVMKHIRSGDLAQAKPNQKALHPYMWSDVFPLYTTPQPDRTAELEAALKMAREALANCAADYLHADSVLTDSALAKINEVLK